jgi:pimeloyl-ACP methyl ester carboxylesterase
MPPPIHGHHWEPADRAKADRTVLLVHGLDEPGRIWDDLAPAIGREGLEVLRFDYPNDQPIRDSADLLERAVGGVLRSGGRLDVVAHSMGGLLARDLLTRPGAGWARDAVGRLITAGTPNAGSPLARTRWLAEVREQLARWVDSPGWMPPGSASPRGVRGGAGADLMPGSPYLTELNARGLPQGPTITVIYGHWWPTLPPEASMGHAIISALGDGVVSLASAILPGVADHVRLAGNHRTMLRRLCPGAVLRARTGRAPAGQDPPAIPVILDRLRRPRAF